ncbi:PD-(D/E)XK nuclease family protein [Bacteroides xylanisolvens]|uniref:PD-(D/E)XK nuclease family protein n=1 Tax=Bacteroides xylanisolvens TaxID=371601 RepID=A0AAW4SPK0_9BACE|nr:PD-(D/E)XK nuclease family protein [Bacteroides xylanisolvens]MCA4531485.1 PD-(D/E)XK nuclease family protein [Bacteroides xylanisolvens]MCA4549524.1 PD-(D/E)XK nuclease family protein [Bacteroides xylanisolvens]MCA4562817.1 PD-(D/E)XK nuclease family protein [Bacteroides xylanisolvens]MCA4567903.1 PD-(D/E)XK nuclease family protein [Bacteroides xylanisolvens]MCA4598425.1 PD-(D/E)XK nuclease family protein [Bacteroides xylanisolvens]
MDITRLQEWLERLNDIPQMEKRRKTFMDISGLAHYENIWSNIYAFFFDVQGEHGFNDLFISSLLELLKEKGQILFLNEFQINREFETNKGGRIDLLLSNEDTAVIIEAKVYHVVNNDFEDYWNSIVKNKKVGVLLTLREHPSIRTSNGGCFINITHKKLIDKVISKIPLYYLAVDNTYQQYLQDFCQTIYNVTAPMETKLLEFYYQNREQINQLSTIKNEIVRYVVNQFEDGELVKMISPDLHIAKRQNKAYVYYKYKSGEVMLTLLYDRLWNWKEHGCRIDIYLEVQGETLNQLKKTNESFLKMLTEEERRYLTSARFEKDGYEHYAHLRININPANVSELLGLKEKVKNAVINSKLLNIADKITQYCKK